MAENGKKLPKIAKKWSKNGQNSTEIWRKRQNLARKSRKIGHNLQKLLKWSKMAKNGAKMVKNGHKKGQNDQKWQKWSKLNRNLAKNGKI